MTPDSSRLLLTFHGLGKPPRALSSGELETWLPVDRYEEILVRVAGYTDVALTFDDGNCSDIELALPLLRRHGLAATFFLVVGRIGMPGFLSADDVIALVKSGMEIGLHGMHHREWRRLEPSLLTDEIYEARKQLAEISGRDVDEAACPFGSYDRHVLRRLRREGYRRVYTSDGGRSDPDAWLQARNTIRRSDPPDVVERLLMPRGSSTRVVRRAKLAMKRWR